MAIKLLFVGTIIHVGIQMTKVASECFSSSLADICSNATPDVPHLSSRDPTFLVTNETLQSEYCDLVALNKQQWYKADSAMATKCPPSFMCGTKFPIWMADSNPEPHEGIVNRTTCLKSFKDCCLIKYRLAAVSCGDYFAYCFIDLPSGCDQRYCFG